MLSTETISFGTLVRQLRKRAGMTQRDLAAALDCSDTQVSNLEKGHRRPDLDAVTTRLIPALGLQDDPQMAALLIERVAAARGERPPASVTLQRTTHRMVQEELDEHSHQLPSSPTELIGRTEEINQLCNRLLGHSGRLLTLVGPPGIGKTRLALAVAQRLQHHYFSGAVFVPLAEIKDAMLMASTITAAMGGSDARSKPPKSHLIEFLRRKSMLLVLDNCEQISDAASLVAELLSACAGVVVLATSRERLHLRAEQRYHVPPLELASAVELFTRRAGSMGTGFVLTDANRPTVEAICQQLDRLPLALELCAAQVDLLSPTQLLAHLHNRRLELLVDGADDLPPRHRTLRHAIYHSYALLSEEERTLFHSLGIFVGGFDLPAIEVITAGSRDSGPQREHFGYLSMLHAIIGKSLVRAETMPFGEQRFYLLESIREFALEQLRAQGEEAGLRSRHYATYLQRFRTADSHLRGLDSAARLARLQPELDNLRAALQWALDEGRYADAAGLMFAVSYFWNQCGFGYEEARWLAHLVPHRQLLSPDQRVVILLTFYRSAFALEEFQPVDPYIREVMALLERCEHKLLHASAWCFLAWATPDIAEAAANIERGIALARAAGESPELMAEFGAIGDRDFVLAAHLWGYAAFLIEQGELARAAPIAAESLQLYQAQGNQAGIAESLGTLGRLALLRGDLAQAHKLFQQVVTFTATLNYTARQSEWQALLAITTLYGGDVSAARLLLMDSLRHCLEQKNTILLAQVCTYLAEVALWEGEPDKAEQWLAQSLAYQVDARRITIFQVERLLVATHIATAQEDYRRAAMLFGLCEQAHSHIHYGYAGPMRGLVDTTQAAMRKALGAEVFEELFTRGQQLSLGEAFATILSPPAVTGRLPEP